jgi:predicted membrane channel-forming protein YqfA (hemolysin III family)
MNNQPTYRKPVGMLAILLFITIWAVLVASLSHSVGTWPTLLQGLFYLLAGTMWLLPLRPLLLWMETGKWRE